MNAAHEWHIRPSELGLCQPEDDVSYMVAYLSTSRKMAGWNAYQVEKEAKRRNNNRFRHR